MVGAVSVDLCAIVMNWMTHVATLQKIRLQYELVYDWHWSTTMYENYVWEKCALAIHFWKTTQHLNTL
jgi:hypothetical protein